MLPEKLYAYFIDGRHRLDAYVYHRYALLLNASVFTSLFSLVYLFVSLLIGFVPGAYFMIFNVIGFLCLPFLMKSDLPVIAIGHVYVTIGTLAVVIIIFFSGGINSPVLPWLIAPPVLALLIVGRVHALIWTGISVACLSALFVYAWQGYEFPVRYDHEWKMFFSFLCASGIILIAVTISLIFEQNTTNALLAVETQKKQLELSQLELAKKHQENLEKNEILAAQREELMTTSEQMKELNEKKDYLLEILAHDLKSPLATTQTMIRLIKKDHFEPDSLEVKIIDMIVESSKKSLGLIQKILNSENLEHILYNLKFEPLNIIEIVRKLAEETKDMALTKQITITFGSSVRDNFFVLADRIYLTQIFENLINNAIKFSPLNKQVYILISETNQAIRVEVKDEGPGIGQHEMDMLFKKFKKLSNKPTGGESSTGLGLSIVKHYTELMQGKVWCESAPGKGCSFFVELPKQLQ